MPAYRVIGTGPQFREPYIVGIVGAETAKEALNKLSAVRKLCGLARVETLDGALVPETQLRRLASAESDAERAALRGRNA